MPLRRYDGETMRSSALTPVFVVLRVALHLLVVVLLGVLFVTVLLNPRPGGVATIVLAVTVTLTYLFGMIAHETIRRPVTAIVWLIVLTAEWLALAALTPVATYLVFPLYFLYLHAFPIAWGIVVCVLATGASMLALIKHELTSLGGVMGPLIAMAIAIVIGLGYRALERETAEREELLAELVAAQSRLAQTEREAGRLTERARLAREIHDTVAQGLSSINMLLHAAEQNDPGRPGIEHVRLARETAESNLGETRRIIRELAPAVLEDAGLAAALGRLAMDTERASGIVVGVETRTNDPGPMSVQTALFRIAQGAMGNIVQHSGAENAVIVLDRCGGAVRLTVRDDGIGFDPNAASGSGQADSFGLRAMRERVAQLDGTIDVTSGSGGTTITVTIGESHTP